MKLTVALFAKIFPKIPKDKLEGLVSAFNKAIVKHEINTVNRVAAFLGQTAHESAMFTAYRENLNYSAKALRATWPARFPNDVVANACARKPELIAAKCYSNRMGNGAENSGDAFKFRGAGWIQLTGRDNISKFASYMHMDVDKALDYLVTPEGAAESAAWYWTTNKLNDFADKGDIVGMTKRINGGTIGLEDRKALYSAAQRALTFA